MTEAETDTVWYGWSTALAGFCELAEELSCDAPAILARHGLDVAALAAPGRPAPTLSLFGAIAELALQSGQPDVALRLLRYQPFEVLGSLGETVRRKANLGEALAELTAIIHTRSTGYVPSLEREGDTAIARFKSLLPAGPLHDVQMDYNVGFAVLMIRGLIGQDWGPEIVELSRTKPARASEWSRFFNCPIHFDAEASVIVFDSADLSRSLAGIQRDGAAQLASEGSVPIDFVQLIDREIIRSLGRGMADLTTAAMALGVTPRTVQRRLERMGTSYQDRLDAVRKAWAHQHLAQGHMSLTELSQLLGYGDLATFSRTFKRWYGLSPRKWRKVQTESLSQ